MNRAGATTRGCCTPKPLPRKRSYRVAPPRTRMGFVPSAFGRLANANRAGAVRREG